MKPVRWLVAGLVWILAGLLGVVGALLSVTVVLLPVAIPVLLLARRLFSLAVGGLGRILARPRTRRVLDRVTGTILIALGVRVAIAK